MIDMHRSEVVLTPFRWFRPRVDRAVLETTYFFGPLRLVLVQR